MLSLPPYRPELKPVEIMGDAIKDWITNM